MESARIHIIEDHPDIIDIVQYNLKKENFSVDSSMNGEEGIHQVFRNKPNLVLLDLMLPKMDGLAVCRTLKANADTKRIPIIMLTAKGEEEDIVKGLEMGADDYVVKPFNQKELIARIRAVLRRSETPSQKLQFRDLVLDSEKHITKLRNEELTLTRTEFRLLKTILSQPGRVFTRDQLIDRITGGDAVIVDRNIDVHVSSLRKKLNDYGEFVVTVRGVGYRFAD